MDIGTSSAIPLPATSEPFTFIRFRIDVATGHQINSASTDQVGIVHIWRGCVRAGPMQRTCEGRIPPCAMDRILKAAIWHEGLCRRFYSEGCHKRQGDGASGEVCQGRKECIEHVFVFLLSCSPLLWHLEDVLGFPALPCASGHVIVDTGCSPSRPACGLLRGGSYLCLAFVHLTFRFGGT